MPGQGIASSARVPGEACSRFPPPLVGPTPRHPHGEVGRVDDSGRGRAGGGWGWGTGTSAPEEHAVEPVLGRERGAGRVVRLGPRRRSGRDARHHLRQGGGGDAEEERQRGTGRQR